MPDRAQITRICCAVAGAVVVPLLWSMGFAGGGKYDEHVASWRIRFMPTENGVGVYESIEMDFGNDRRTGIDRSISNSLGAPALVSGLPFSDSPGEVPLPGSTMTLTYAEQAIRTRGDATVARLEAGGGQLADVHQLIALYALPTALGPGDTFEYELIGPDRSVDATDVTVYVDRVELDSPMCRRRSRVPCELQRTAEGYEIHLASLPADDALTIGGTITGVRPPADRLLSLQADIRGRPALGWILWLLPIGAAVAGWHLSLSRWRRRSAAKWRAVAPPVVDANGEPLPALVALSSLSPWEGSALLHHEVGLSSAAAWFAEQVAAGVLTVDTVNSVAVFRRGPSFDDADLGMRDELARLFGRKADIRLEPYQRPMKRVVGVVRHRQASALQVHPWWRRFAPGGRDWFSPQVVGVLVGWALVLAALVVTHWSYSWPVAFALLVLVPASVNAAVAWWMAPQLGAEGEEAVAALAPLQQMLRRADTSHVEAAHRAGLLPEYGAWAVALGASNRWLAAVRAADIPADAVDAALAPLEMGRNGGPWSISGSFPSNELQPSLRPEPAKA